MDIKQSSIDRVVQIYKCVILTIVALLLLGIFSKIPKPFTLNNIQAKKVQIKDIPLVRVSGGNLDVEVINTPIEVEGTVSIEP